MIQLTTPINLVHPLHFIRRMVSSNGKSSCDHIISFAIDVGQHEDHSVSRVYIETAIHELPSQSTIAIDQARMDIEDHWEPTTASNWDEARELDLSC